MSKLKKFQSLFWFAVVLGILAVYFLSAGIDIESYEKVKDSLRTLKEENALLNQNILRTRYYLDLTYDGVNFSMGNIQKELLRFDTTRKRILPDNKTQVHQIFVEYQSLMEKRKVLLDNFKAKNAILKNSLYYFPISIRQVRFRIKNDQLINELLRDVLLFTLEESPELRVKIKEKLLALEKLGLKKTPRALEEVDILSRHVDNIMLKKGEVDKIVHEILRQPADVLINNLNNAFERRHFQAIYKASIFRLLLFALTSALAIYVVMTILKLNVARVSLQVANRSLTRFNMAAGRFVPRAFLDTLGRHDIVEVKLGDHARDSMAVLFTDIREFTTLSESLGTEGSFAFINSYLARVGPAINKHGGFIDKYIGDAIMALFSGSVDKALDAGIEILQELNKFNQERARAGGEPIQIGIGLHYGDVMLGTIGEQNRMEGTVISDAVNLAARVENLTKEYPTPFLISETVRDQLSNPDDYCLRFVDRTVVKGKTEPVSVYEVFDADPEPIKALKLQTASSFQEGIALSARGDLEAAVVKLKGVLALYRDDVVTQVHLERIEARLSLIS